MGGEGRGLQTKNTSVRDVDSRAVDTVIPRAHFSFGGESKLSSLMLCFSGSTTHDHWIYLVSLKPRGRCQKDVKKFSKTYQKLHPRGHDMAFRR